MSRKFELVSKYIGTKIEQNFIMPRRATKGSACYDIFNNTGADIVINPGETSKAVTTHLKIKMPISNVCLFYVRSSTGFKTGTRLANSTGVIDCVPAGTLISTPSGDIPVEAFINISNPKIYSFNEELNTIEEDTINDIWVVNDLSLMRIETTNGTVEIPLEKTVFTKRGWVSAKDLNLSDEILGI